MGCPAWRMVRSLGLEVVVGLFWLIVREEPKLGRVVMVVIVVLGLVGLFVTPCSCSGEEEATLAPLPASSARQPLLSNRKRYVNPASSYSTIR